MPAWTAGITGCSRGNTRYLLARGVLFALHSWLLVQKCPSGVVSNNLLGPCVCDVVFECTRAAATWAHVYTTHYYQSLSYHAACVIQVPQCVTAHTDRSLPSTSPQTPSLHYSLGVFMGRVSRALGGHTLAPSPLPSTPPVLAVMPQTMVEEKKTGSSTSACAREAAPGARAAASLTTRGRAKAAVGRAEEDGLTEVAGNTPINMCPHTEAASDSRGQGFDHPALHRNFHWHMPSTAASLSALQATIDTLQEDRR